MDTTQQVYVAQIVDRMDDVYVFATEADRGRFVASLDESTRSVTLLIDVVPADSATTDELIAQERDAS